MSKMKNVFEQVMLVDGSRRMRGDIIQKTFKVRTVYIRTPYMHMHAYHTAPPKAPMLELFIIS